MSDETPVERQWDVRTNLHPNCDGTPWGWIEGDPMRRCWSNHYGSSFTRDHASRVVRDHNSSLLAKCREGGR